MINLYKLRIQNFRSLKDFESDFKKFTCLIGLNSSGKSTILQSLDFLSQQMNGTISEWLKNRNWESKELNLKLSNKKLIQGSLSFYYNKFFYVWRFTFNPNLNKCTYETINENVENEKTIFQVKDSKYMLIKDIEKNEKIQGDIVQDYEGSFLSSLKAEFLPKPILEFKTYMQNIYSLDLLSPQELRKRSRVGSKLGLSGENISAFLNTFSKDQQKEILDQLKKCYPNLEDLAIRKSKAGWSRLELVEVFKDKRLTNEAKYLNDGVLRLIAILAQLQSEKSFLLFDEIENGINPELIEFLIDTLIASKHQVMITTHSPMILNYIEDDIAKDSVQYIYKTEEGFTKSIPFFNIPSMKEKLEYMGAGEVYVDTNLTELYDEIKLIEENKEEK